jgi:hypothetical protein
MAALRASAKLDAAMEAPLPADRRRHKRRSREQPPPALPQPAALAQPEVQPPAEVPSVNNAVVVWHVDKSALSLSEPRRYRDRAHLKFVASQPCLRCERQPSEPHHLRFVQLRALGRKVSDEYAVPLCRTHHQNSTLPHGDFTGNGARLCGNTTTRNGLPTGPGCIVVYRQQYLSPLGGGPVMGN